MFTEHHINLQADKLYLHMLRKECELEKSILQNKQILATLSPDHLSYSKFGIGHYAKVVAEVIYVIRCTPIRVNLVQTERCYNELPVLKNNKTLKFLTPIILEF